MGQEDPAENNTDAVVEQEEPQLDPQKLEAFNARLLDEQNLVMALVGGGVAALAGAAIWATVTVVTGYQIGWMAVAVGFLAGYVVRFFGKGLSNTYGIIGAGSAFLGCILGNLFSTCGFIAAEESVSAFVVIFTVLLQPAAVVELLTATFSGMDILFYGIAIYEGYKFSFRQVTESEIAELV